MVHVAFFSAAPHDMERENRTVCQCHYCGVMGTLPVLENHHQTVHPGDPFRVSEALFARYGCGECPFATFTQEHVEYHFATEHAGLDCRFFVATSTACTAPTIDVLNVVRMIMSEAPAFPPPTAEYTCVWCWELWDYEDLVILHHALYHRGTALEYEVRPLPEGFVE